MVPMRCLKPLLPPSEEDWPIVRGDPHRHRAGREVSK